MYYNSRVVPEVPPSVLPGPTEPLDSRMHTVELDGVADGADDSKGGLDTSAAVGVMVVDVEGKPKSSLTSAYRSADEDSPPGTQILSSLRFIGWDLSLLCLYVGSIQARIEFFWKRTPSANHLTSTSFWPAGHLSMSRRTIAVCSILPVRAGTERKQDRLSAIHSAGYVLMANRIPS